MFKSVIASGVAQGPNNETQAIEIVPPNTPFYGFFIDWLLPNEGTILYGRNAKTGLAMAVGQGSKFFHAKGETGGLYLIIDNGVEVSMQSLNDNPVARILVALAPVSGADIELKNIWDRARNVQALVEMTAGGGNKATIRLNNFPPSFQDVTPALFPIGRWGNRIMRVNHLRIESSATGRILLGWAGALDGTQPAVVAVNPMPLGSDDTPGGCLPSGNDAAVALVKLAHPLITIGQQLELSLGWSVLPGWALCIQDDSLASTLRVDANYDVAKLEPEDA